MDVATLESTTKWARFAIIALIATSLFDIIDWVLSLGWLGEVSIAVLDTQETLITVSSFAIFPLLFVNLRWIYVAAKFYQTRAHEGHIRPGWAVWSNFIPFANLWSPYVQITRIWAVSAAPRHGTPHWLKVWWAAWVFQFLAATVIVIFVMNSSNLTELDAAFIYITPIFIFIDVLGMILFYRIVTMIGRSHATDVDVFR